jgi:hypothetical protein
VNKPEEVDIPPSPPKIRCIKPRIEHKKEKPMTSNIEMLEEEIDSSRFREMTTTINMPENE